jgi:hypothetical protein
MTAAIRGWVLDPTTASPVSASSGEPVALGRVDASERRAGLRESRCPMGDSIREAERAAGNYAMIGTAI